MMYDMNLIIIMEVTLAVIGILAFISLCTLFTVLGLSGRFHFEKKKEEKGDGGW